MRQVGIWHLPYLLWIISQPMIIISAELCRGCYIWSPHRVVCVWACRLSHIWFFVTPWMVAHQAPLSMEFSRQEYWSGFPFPPSRDLPDPQFKPVSLVSSALAGRFFTSVPLGSPCHIIVTCYLRDLVYVSSPPWIPASSPIKWGQYFKAPSNFNMLYSTGVKLLLMSRYSVLKIKLIWCYSVTLRVIFYDYSQYEPFSLKVFIIQFPKLSDEKTK